MRFDDDIINPVAQTNKPDLLAHFNAYYCTSPIHTITHQLEKIGHVAYMSFSRVMIKYLLAVIIS